MFKDILKKRMEKVVEASQLPEGERVYLRKNKLLGWKVVEPPIDENDNIKWLSLLFGSKSNIIFLVIVIVIAGMLYYGFADVLKSCQAMASNPCLYCMSNTPNLLNITIPK
jgi:hypothetical protein